MAARARSPGRTFAALERFPSQCKCDVETHICVLHIERIDDKHTKQRKDANMRLYIVYISLETALGPI